MKTILGSFILVALLGCAKTMWVHDQYTPDKFTTDTQQCSYEVNLASAGGRPAQGFEQIILKGAVRHDLFEQCMQIKGWYKQKGTA